MTDLEFVAALKTYVRDNAPPPVATAQQDDGRVAYTVKEAADAIGVSVPTIRNMMHSADFPAYKIGQKVFIDAAGFRAWSAQNAANRVGLR